MTWLYGQASLWYLIAFVVGVLLAWLLLVLPQQRRLSRLRARRPSETGAAKARAWSGPAADPDPPAGPDRSDAEPIGSRSAAPAGGPGHGVPAVAPGPWPGSALPAPDGSAPTEAFTIKGNAGSMLYHTPASPYYSRIRAEAWFSSTEDAEAAGFIAWKRR